MKRFLFAIVLSAISFSIIMASTPNIFVLGDLISYKSNATDDWILIGEVSLSTYNGNDDTIKANLYVREIGNNLIYRVEYHGAYYATRWHDDSKTYHVTINNTIYRCDVPAISNGNTSTDHSQNKFVGVWKSAEKGFRDYGDTQISNKDGKLFVQMKKKSGLQSQFATGNIDYIEWSIDVNVDYGKWHVAVYEPYVGQVIVGDGYSYTDRRKPLGGVSSENSIANKEILREYYRARIKDGNLNISISYKYLYYYDNNYRFSCEGEYTINDVIYTKW